MTKLRLAYADPPYPGQSRRHYADHPDYAGEVDHEALVEQLRGYPDGWALSTSSTALRDVWNLCPEARLAVWTKGFAAFKNQRITFAWEPVLYVARSGAAENVGSFVRDWVSAMPPIFTRSNIDDTRGQKPDEFSFWLFDLLGLRPTDEFVDLFPGSGAVGAAWERWKRQPRAPRGCRVSAPKQPTRNAAPRRYRKKPVVIEAMHYDGSMDTQRAIVNWAEPGRIEGFFDSEYHLVIHTLEGPLRVGPGWWVIKGIAGEFYPCKPDIFEETYEPA